LFGLLVAPLAGAFELTVSGPAGEPVTAYRWLVEEDSTYNVQPGVLDPLTLAVRFHQSYMPLVAKGDELTPPSGLVLDPTKHYYVSVLPAAGFSIGGGRLRGDQAQLTVLVQPLPLPTAQITVFVYEDVLPINNIPDLPAETGLAGFTIMLEDAGGRYGQNGGQLSTDAFGNPLGTTYAADGSVVQMGTGVILTDANGEAVIKNLAPGKYGVQAVPPAGQQWQQTATIEGTKVIDAWVKSNEPGYFMEFGPPSWHVDVGFVRPMNDTSVLDGSATLTGRVVNLHTARPPEVGFFLGAPLAHTTCWVGLNEMGVGTGRGVFAQPCLDGNAFAIPNVPAGNYELVIFDTQLDQIVAFKLLTVPDGAGTIDLGDVSVFQWFARLEGHVFLDANQNGFPDPGEIGIPDVPLNIRFRDGTIYQSFPTDLEGFVPFDEVFPFFNWLVLEVDFTRFKATGGTFVVDAGGAIDPADPWSFGGQLSPQPQADPANPGASLPYRTETGPVLLEAFQAFLGQTNVAFFGKAPYAAGENGGISGIVRYATTRAENDPRWTAGENWEPGIPRVQVALYADGDRDMAPMGNFPAAEDLDWDADGVFDASDGVVDDVDGDGLPTYADVDNAPFGFRAVDGALATPPGPEDVDRNGDGLFDLGDALDVVTTDSFDDSAPSGCVGPVFTHLGVPTDCYDGLRNFNQLRPGVFDGGYAFTGLPAGVYIVEAALPRGPDGSPTYELVKEEDKNVDFGDSYNPATKLGAKGKISLDPLLVPPCVGDDHLVPDELSLFPGVPSAYAGQLRPLCDRKQVALRDRQNAAADFALFTEVPVAGHIVGFVLDDLSNEFDPTSPQFGEKYAPPWMPVSIRDWTGREISRVYTDMWGTYNALVPSTYTTNVPSPSGVAPSMMTVCLNNPGPIPDASRPGRMVMDPFFDRRYSQFCYTFQYMPGTTTYLDTPVLPVSAFTGPDKLQVDCEYPDGTPRLDTVDGPDGGPYLRAGQVLTITSEGSVFVPNPVYGGPLSAEPRLILRDFGFGASPGQVTLGGVQLPLAPGSLWSPDSLRVVIPAAARTGDLVVTRGDNGQSTVHGITVTVAQAGDNYSVLRVPRRGTIQAAIDAAKPGDLILVPPGIYEEMVIMWKPVRLQGAGAGSTIINAVKAPAEKLTAWRLKVDQLIADGLIELLPGQEQVLAGLEPEALFTEEGAGVLVLGRNVGVNQGGFGLRQGLPNARIDGFTITGADHGGGVTVNGYARQLDIANNRITNNTGFFGGGVRIGHPQLTADGEYVSAASRFVKVRRNQIALNGGQGGAGAGVSMHTGADDYLIADNFICGNFNLGDGGGVGHLGLSRRGRIERNRIVFNEVFNQGAPTSGGGIFIGGQPPLIGQVLTEGAGNVLVDRNVLLGNSAGAGDGGAIRLALVNGVDALGRTWHTVNLTNNLISNNVAAMAGGGLSLQDAARVRIAHNTIAHNISTATAGAAFSLGDPNISAAQPAGVVSYAHSAALRAAFGTRPGTLPYREFSNPLMQNNIIWQNLSLHFETDNTTTPASYRLLPDVFAGDAPTYWDLAVIGTAVPASLDPRYSLLTDTSGYHASNVSGDPSFQAWYVNGSRGHLVIPEVTTGIQAPPAFDEGGNFIRLSFGPLTLRDPVTNEPFADLHLVSGSAALNRAYLDFGLLVQLPSLLFDVDGQGRSMNIFGIYAPDIGADESPL